MGLVAYMRINADDILMRNVSSIRIYPQPPARARSYVPLLPTCQEQDQQTFAGLRAQWLKHDNVTVHPNNQVWYPSTFSSYFPGMNVSE